MTETLKSSTGKLNADNLADMVCKLVNDIDPTEINRGSIITSAINQVLKNNGASFKKYWDCIESSPNHKHFITKHDKTVDYFYSAIMNQRQTPLLTYYAKIYIQECINF